MGISPMDTTRIPDTGITRGQAAYLTVEGLKGSTVDGWGTLEELSPKGKSEMRYAWDTSEEARDLMEDEPPKAWWTRKDQSEAEIRAEIHEMDTP